MDRYARELAVRHPRRLQQAAVLIRPACLGPFVCFREQHGDHAEHAHHQHRADEHAAHRQVLLREIVKRPDQQRGCGVHHHGEEAAAAVTQRVAVEIEQPQHERRGQHGCGCQHVPVRHAHDRRAELEFLLAVRVVDAPVRAHLAFGRGFPWLVERFHHEILEPLLLGVREEAAQEQRLVGGRCHCRFAGAAFARPAHFADHDRLARERALHFGELRDDVTDGGLDLDAFPVRQHVHGDEVDVRGQFRMLDPDVPGLGGAHGLPRRCTHAIEVGEQVGHGQVAAQHDFVADEHAVDVAVLVRQPDDGFDLALVALAVRIEPAAEHDLQVMLARQGRNLAE